MAWTSPMTAVAGSVYTAAQYNQFTRDNFNETGPAKISAAGQILVGLAANSLVARTPVTNTVSASETTGSTTYAAIATALSVTAVTGTSAIVINSLSVANNTSGQNAYGSYQVSGPSTVAASDDRALLITAEGAGQVLHASLVFFETGLTPGSNVFSARYRVTGGTGTFSSRQLTVIPL